MHYRLYKPNDFAALYAIEEVCFQPPHRFSRGYMRQIVEQEISATWIAEADGRMCGFGVVDWSEEPQGLVAYVQTLEVSPEQRGLGVGVELLGRLEAAAREAGAVAIWLHVDVENTAAIRVYEKSEYRKSGTEPDYYGRGRPGVVYAKKFVENAAY